MKIECGWNDGVSFKPLIPGDCFFFEGRVFMRVETFCNEDGSEYNAIDLVKGSWIGIGDFEKVVPIDGKFVIDP